MTECLCDGVLEVEIHVSSLYYVCISLIWFLAVFIVFSS